MILFSFITISSAKGNDKKMKRGMFRTGNIPLLREPKAGLEPATYSLRMSYSTN